MNDYEALNVAFARAWSHEATLWHSATGSDGRCVTVIVSPGHLPQGFLHDVSLAWDKWMSEVSQRQQYPSADMRVEEQGLQLPYPFDCGPIGPILLPEPPADGDGKVD